MHTLSVSEISSWHEISLVTSLQKGILFKSSQSCNYCWLVRVSSRICWILGIRVPYSALSSMPQNSSFETSWFRDHFAIFVSPWFCRLEVVVFTNSR
jgi:hypothetical protein